MRNYVIPSKIIIPVFLIVICSCKKFVEISVPKNQLVSSEVFKDSADATAAVLGIYIDMMQNQTLTIANGGVTVATGLSSDELSTTLNVSGIPEFYTNSISTTNSLNNDVWVYAYKFLYETNACIEGINQSHSISSSVKNQLIGESKFLRAFLYFNLTNLYGAVPIVTNTDYHKSQLLGRSPQDSVYRQILSDLLDAKERLSSNVISTNKLRVNFYTVCAFLSKIYLYLKDFSKAESETSIVINSGVYKLERTINNVFLATSGETIFAMQSILSNIETFEGKTFVPILNRRPSYPISSYLLNCFESNDKRSETGNWITTITSSGITYYIPYKYKQSQHLNSTPLENYVVLRLAELFLIRAEARAQQNKIQSSIDDINMVRVRAGLDPLASTLNQDQTVSAIQKERRVELFCEWGNRWFDLKRTNQADVVLKPEKGSNWQSTDALYPIPQNEINNNRFLDQNSGY
jgi:starch-binding outer membrane protein, SusD/RagB family